MLPGQIFPGQMSVRGAIIIENKKNLGIIQNKIKLLWGHNPLNWFRFLLLYNSCFYIYLWLPYTTYGDQLKLFWSFFVVAVFVLSVGIAVVVVSDINVVFIAVAVYIWL